MNMLRGPCGKRLLSLVAGMMLGCAPGAEANTQLWLAPISKWNPQNIGSDDYMRLVTDPAEWSSVASQTTVFKLYPFFVGRAPDADLKAIIGRMRHEGIALALEGRILVTTRGCAMPHGDGGEATLHLLERIRRLGGKVEYFAMDEPLKHTLAGDSRCRGRIEDAARETAQRVQEFRTVFPDLAVGDIEPVGTWRDAPRLLVDTVSWIRAYRSAVGEPMAFFHADVGWTTRWVNICDQLQRSLVSLDVPFGMIYNGEDLAPSPAAWAKQAVMHFRRYEDGTRLPPSMAVIQSWVRYPLKAVPEADSESLTGIASAYLKFRHLPAK